MSTQANLTEAWAAALGGAEPPPSALESAWADALDTKAATAPSAIERAFLAALSGPALEEVKAAPTLPGPVELAAIPAPPQPAEWEASFARGADGLVSSVLVHSDEPGTTTWLLTPVRDAEGRLAAATIEPLLKG